jgi:hypothetical protein
MRSSLLPSRPKDLELPAARPTRGRRRSDKRIQPNAPATTKWAYWWVSWSVIVLAGLILKFLASTTYLFGSIYDDQLMVEMAHGFLQGHWSSSWATTGFATLVKPVGYPIFLASVHALPWSPVFSAYVLYVIGSALIAWGWFRIRRSRPQVTLILTMLVFNPIAFTVQNQRVYRDLFMMALSTLTLGVSLLLASLLHDWAGGASNPEDGEHSDRRLASSTPKRWALAYALVLALGFIVGYAAITKETWVLLLPVAIAPLLYPLIQRFRPSRFRPLPVLRAAIAGLVFLGCVWGLTTATKQLNQRHYHVAVVNDLSSGGYARAWKLWASVEAGPPRKYVAITRAMRLAVYRVSPTAAEMEPFLESPKDQWKLDDCQAMRICDESGPWFEWDLLTSAFLTGKVNSVYQIQTFFSHIADDIARGCNQGELHCSASPVLAAGLPRLNQIPLSTVGFDTVNGLRMMVWDKLPMAKTTGYTVTPSSVVAYDLWSSVVPAMPTLANLAKGTESSNGSAMIYPILRAIDGIYRIVDLMLLAAIILAFGVWIVALTRQHGKRAPRDREAALISLLLFISTLVGMGMLAVLGAADDPTYYTFPLYWADFAAVAQLCLMFALFSLLPHQVREASHERAASTQVRVDLLAR